MDKTFCVICKIFHAPNEGCPVYVPMLTAVPQCPSCAALRARIEDVEQLRALMILAWEGRMSFLDAARAVSAWLKEGWGR
jgi:hypothetical protein